MKRLIYAEHALSDLEGIMDYIVEIIPLPPYGLVKDFSRRPTCWSKTQSLALRAMN